MKLLQITLMFVALCFAYGKEFQWGEEKKMLLSLHDHFHIKYFIFVNDSSARLAKYFSEKNVFSSTISFSELENMLKSSVNLPKNRIMLIMNFNTEIGRFLKLNFSSSYVWLVFGEYENKAFENFYIPVNYEFFLVYRNDFSTKIRKLYFIKNRKFFHTLDVDTHKGILRMAENIQDKLNMHRTVINVGLACRPKGDRIGANEFVECRHEELVEYLSKKTNFIINAMKDPLQQYRPYEYLNGTYGTLFQPLIHQTADISCGSFSITESRAKDFDFIWPTFTYKTMMYMREDILESSWLSYLKPFDVDAWWSFLGWMATMTGFIFFSTSIDFNQKYHCHGIRILGSIFHVFRIISNQGSSSTCQSVSSRVVIATALLSFVFLFQFYSGCLLSFLTAQIPRLPFNNLEELVADGRYKVSALNNGFLFYYFKSELKGSFLQEADKLPSTNQEGVDGICNNFLVFAGVKEDVLNIVKYKCKLSEIPTPFAYQYLGLGLVKRSPYKEYFDRELVAMRSIGMLKRISSQYIGFSTLKVGTKEEEISVSINSVLPCLVVLTAGCFLSFLIVMVEIKISRR